MQWPRLTRWSTAAALLLSLLGPRDASADWPVARHDPQRTGTATGTSNITIPVAFWRYYLGGFIGATNLRTFDVDSDGVGEVVVVTGGRAIAKELSDETRWETPSLELTAMDGFADLDGDGAVELIAHSSGRVYVIDPTDGTIDWAEPAGEMGTIGGVRIGDVSGDGVADLVIGECGCCRVRSATPGVVYSFASALTAPTLLSTFPITSCGGSSGALSLVNADSNPGMELLLGEESRLSLVDGLTGNVLASSPALGTKLQRSQCAGVDLDGVAGDEIVCLMSVSDPPATDQRRAFALRYVSSPTPALELLWSTKLAPDAGELKWLDPIGDLDGDGTTEVVASSKDANGTWTTKILAGETGVVLATIPDSITRGVAHTLPNGEATLLTTLDTSPTAWSFSRTATPPVSQRWTLQNTDVLIDDEPAAIAQSSLTDHVLSVDADGDGRDDLLVRSRSGPAAVTAYATSSIGVADVGRFALPPDRDLVSAWATQPGQRLGVLAVLQDDGIVRVLDEGLVPFASTDDVVAAGLRFGGYFLTGGWRALTRHDGRCTTGRWRTRRHRRARQSRFSGSPRRRCCKLGLTPAHRVGAQGRLLARDRAQAVGGQSGHRLFRVRPARLRRPGLRDLRTPTGWRARLERGCTQEAHQRHLARTLQRRRGSRSGLRVGRSRRHPGAEASGIWSDGGDDLAIRAARSRGRPSTRGARRRRVERRWPRRRLSPIESTRVISGADGTELANSGFGPAVLPANPREPGRRSTRRSHVAGWLSTRADAGRRSLLGPVVEL